MKNLIRAFVLLLSFLLVGCGGDQWTVIASGRIEKIDRHPAGYAHKESTIVHFESGEILTLYGHPNMKSVVGKYVVIERNWIDGKYGFRVK